MTLAMTVDEREAFLAEVHIGVFSVDRSGRGPLTVPIWYSYGPGSDVTVIIGPTTLKAKLLEQAGRFSLCAQTETAPYKYVSVEGPVRVTEPVNADERRAMAYRYLGAELGDMYIEATEADSAGNVAVRMTPEHWLTTDYGKQFG